MVADSDTFTSDTVGDDDVVPVKPNAKQTNVGGDFPHMFDISELEMEARVCWSSPTRSRTRQRLLAVTAATSRERCSHSRDDGIKLCLWVSPVMVGQASRVPSTMNDYGHIPAIEGTFKCTDGPCSLVYTGSGDDVMVTEVTGYTFSGSREGVTRLWKLLRRQTTSSSVSGWMKRG